MASLFLSYARQEDEEFVRRLCHDLREQGHDVWVDFESMPSRGESFLKEIQDAITARDRLLLVVGPRAMQSAYVSAEWRWALEIGKPINPVLRKGDYPILPVELRLLDAPDFRSDADYSQRLQTLLRQLSEPVPPMGKLVAVPSLPPHLLQQRDRLRALKEALLADFRRPVVMSGAAARTGLHGMGGIGKSVLAATLARDHEVRRAFPDGLLWVSLGISPSLVQAQRDLAKALGDPADFENETQGRNRIAGLLREKAVLLVLDDAWDFQHVRSWDVLGPRGRLLVTTRDAALLTALGGTHYQVQLLTAEESLHLLAQWSQQPSGSLPPAAMEIVSQCERLPLALAICGALIRDGRTWEDIASALQAADLKFLDHPHGNIERSIQISVECLSPDERQRFAELAVFPADEAIPEQAIVTLWAHTSGQPERDARAMLSRLARRALVRIEAEPPRPGAAPANRVTLHSLIFDYVSRSAGDPQALHRKLLHAYQRQCPTGWPSGKDDGYFLTHLRGHLLQVDRGSELADLLLDLRWLEAKHAAGLTFDLLGDFAAAIGACPTEDRRRLLRLVEEALRRDIHFIHRHSHDFPQALFQCLWNTGWWYDCPAAAAHYGAPAGGAMAPELRYKWNRRIGYGAGIAAALAVLALLPYSEFVQEWAFLLLCLSGAGAFVAAGALSNFVLTRTGWKQARPWRAPGEKLYKLLETWRLLKEQWTPGFVWLRSEWPPAIPLGTALHAVMRGHRQYVFAVAYSPDGNLIVSGGSDGTVRLWDARSGQPLAVFGDELPAATEIELQRLRRELIDKQQPLPDVQRVCFSADSRRVMAQRAGGQTRAWDILSRAEVTESVTLPSSPGAQTTPDGRWRVEANADHLVELRDAVTSRLVAVLGLHDDQINELALSPDGRRAVTGSRDGTVRVWKVEPTQQFASLLQQRAIVGGSIAFSPDGCLLAHGTEFPAGVAVCDLRSGNSWRIAMSDPLNFVTEVEFLPDSRRLACVSMLGPVRLVTGGTTSLERGLSAVFDHQPAAVELTGNKNPITSVAISPNGQFVFATERDGPIRCWSADGKLLDEMAPLTLMDMPLPTGGIAVSPDGKLVAIAAWLMVFVYKLGGGRLHVLVPGEGNERIVDKFQIDAVAFSPDSQRVLARAADHKSVVIWDAASGEPVSVVQGTGDLQALAAGPDRLPYRADAQPGETALVSSATQKVMAWYPESLYYLRTHPQGQRWFGRAFDRQQPHHFSLEGAAHSS